MTNKQMIAVALVLGSSILQACVGADGAGSNDQSGQVTIALALAPTDARCLVITATPPTGAATVRQIPVDPQQTAAFQLSGLPTGVSITLTEQVFTAACPVPNSAAPTWASDAVAVTLQPGVPTNVTLNLQRVASGGQVNVTSNFPGATNAITSFTITAAFSQPDDICTGPDDNLWFTDAAGFIGRLTTAGVATRFALPSASPDLRIPLGIAAGPDGNLWYADISANKIGRITTAGAITEFNVPTANSEPVGIVAGRDGRLWFSEQVANKIGRITTAGVITEFAIPTASSSPRLLAVGPDNNVWFVESAGKIGRITSAGTITEFAIPTAGSAPNGITAGPDGNLWFTEENGNKIGRITPTGSIVEFALPSTNASPSEITTGPDGNLWFTEMFAGVGRITTAGVVTEFAGPTPGPEMQGITTGPDANLWFVDLGNQQIDRISP